MPDSLHLAGQLEFIVEKPWCNVERSAFCGTATIGFGQRSMADWKYRGSDL